MITSEILLENGYRKWESNNILHPHSNCFFQKRIKNDGGRTRYFITFYEYIWEDEIKPNYIVNLQFEKENYTMNIELFAINEKMTLEEIEKEVYEMWPMLNCKYYEEK